MSIVRKLLGKNSTFRVAIMRGKRTRKFFCIIYESGGAAVGGGGVAFAEREIYRTAKHSKKNMAMDEAIDYFVGESLVRNGRGYPPPPSAR